MTTRKGIGKAAKKAVPVQTRRLPLDVRLRALELAVSVSGISYSYAGSNSWPDTRVSQRQKNFEDTATIIKAAEAFLSFLE